MANITYSVIEKSCNKLLIGKKTYWKSIALPSLLYGTNIINLTDDNIIELEIIENSVYRCIRGEIGESLMRKIVINGTITYVKGIQIKRNE